MSTYFGLLWQKNKQLFVVACLFAGGLFLPSIVHFEITPFYDWRMYAWPAQAHKEYDAYVLYCDGRLYNEPHTWQDYRRMMIMYTMPHYNAIRETGDTLPFNTKTSRLALAAFRWNHHDNILHMTTADLDRYPDWLKRYAAQQTGQRCQTIEVERVRLTYTTGNRVVPAKTERIFSR